MHAIQGKQRRIQDSKILSSLGVRRGEKIGFKVNCRDTRVAQLVKCPTQV